MLFHSPTSFAATTDATRHRTPMLTPTWTFAITIRHFADETGALAAHPAQSTAGYRTQTGFDQECVQGDGERGEFAHDLVGTSPRIGVVLPL